MLGRMSATTELAQRTMARVGLDRQVFVSSLAVAVPLVTTSALWVAGELSTGTTDFFSELAQITGLLALVLLAMALVISARSRIVEEFYGGLDRSYRTHGRLAKAGFAIMLVHPWLLVPHVWTHAPGELASLILPGYTFPKTLGIGGYWLFVFLVGLTIFRALDYQRWWRTHRFMGAAFLLSGMHALLAYSDVRYFGPLRSWIGFWVVAGLLSWAYKTFLYERLAPRHPYRVVSCTPLGAGVYDLVLKAQRTRLNHAPGEFAFLSVRGHPDVPDEHHPLSIASAPHSSLLRFGFKAVGDWTKQLAALRPGDAVDVFGPYGEFHSYNLHHYQKQVWIGGGIGVTPFLSMIRYETGNDDRKSLWMYYVVNNEAQAPFHDELTRLAAASDDDMHYTCVTSDSQGYLTAERVRDEVGDLSDAVILLCGPGAMMHGLTAGFVKLGVPRSRIVFEDFAFF